jgi:hypothetical protein
MAMNGDAHAAFLPPVVAVAVAALLLVASPAFGGCSSAGKVMITNNPDGTFTIQKTPQKGTCGHSKGRSGLVIPPQVVVPMVPAGGKRP